MQIVLRTFSTNSDYNADCDCAVIDVTAELLEVVRRRVAVARQALSQDKELWELYFWDGGPDFYDYTLLDACDTADMLASAIANEEPDPVPWSDQLRANGYLLLPEGVDLSGHEPHRMEIPQMIVRCSPGKDGFEFEVAWTATPKHADLYITTEAVPLPALERFLQEASA
jgi:hypothetical protein